MSSNKIESTTQHGQNNQPNMEESKKLHIGDRNLKITDKIWVYASASNVIIEVVNANQIQDNPTEWEKQQRTRSAKIKNN